MSQFCTELVKGLFTLSAVALGSYIALRVYFRQKEYELVKQRYLEGALDQISAQLESSLGAASHNWARSMQICKSFRDTGANFDLSELNKGFIDYDNSKFQQIAHHRLGSLIKTQVIWESFQSALAWANGANNMFVKEVPEAIRLRCTTSLIDVDQAAMSEKMIADMNDVHRKGFKYAHLQTALLRLSQILEGEQLSFKALSEFSSRPAVKQILNDLKNSFEQAEKSEEVQ